MAAYAFVYTHPIRHVGKAAYQSDQETGMKTRAAIAWKAGAPVTVEEVELEGPKAGEVLLY